MALVAGLLVAGDVSAQDKGGVVRLDPEAFAAEVAKGERAAATKYKGKAIELSGKVADVHRAADGRVFISLPAKSAGILGVTCFLKDPDVFGKVVKGQDVTVRGKVGDMPVGVQLADCELVNVGPSPALTYTAQEMAAEWARDRRAAGRKWAGKVVIVSGVVADTRANDVGAINAFLRGADPVWVDCGFTAFEKAAAEKIKAGDRVKVVGEFWNPESGPAGPALRYCHLVPE